MRAICLLLLSMSMAIVADALPDDEAALIECAAENTAGAVFIHSMLELHGENDFLHDLSARQQVRATELILTAEGRQVERFHPAPVSRTAAEDIATALDQGTGSRLEELGQMLESGETRALLDRLAAAPACGGS